MPSTVIHRWAPGLALAGMLGLALLSGCHSAARESSPREFEHQWREFLERRRFGAADSLIAARAARYPDDPEVVVARGNLYFRMAESGRPHGAANAAPGESRAGAAATSTAGGIDPAAPDTLLLARAIDVLSEGIRRHPERLDIRFGLAFLLQQAGLPGAEIEVVRATLDYATRHPESLRWSYGEPLPSPPEEYVPKTVRDYMKFYLERGAPGDERAMLELAALATQAYPKSPEVMNDVAYFYGSRGDWKTSLRYLLRAEHADSTDALVLYNIGWAQEHLGKRDPALRYYRRSVLAAEAGGKTDVAESSRERIAALGGEVQ